MAGIGNLAALLMEWPPTGLVQPLDHQIIANVKASYAFKTFTMLEREACSDIEADSVEEHGVSLLF